MARIRVYFPNIQALFSNFQERTGETSLSTQPLPLSSYAPGLRCH